MRTLFDTDEEEVAEGKASEITLSTASLLGIFFGLVLICGVFFGFGYSMGRGTGAGSSAKALENSPAEAEETAAAANPPAPVPTSRTRRLVLKPRNHPPSLVPNRRMRLRRTRPVKTRPET